MFKNLITRDECADIIREFNDNAINEVKVIEYDIDRYSEGYPGFLGEYYSLKIRFIKVSSMTNAFRRPR